MFCRPQSRTRLGVEIIFWDTHQKISGEELTALVRKPLFDCGMIDFDEVATRSGKRTEMQLYDALGMTDKWAQNAGGWDSA